MDPCLSPERLTAHLHGETAGPEAAAAARHLAACGACRGRLAGLARVDAALRAGARASVAAGPSCPGDEALHALLAGAVAGDRRAETESHLSGCPRCAAALAVLRDAASPGAGLSPGLRRRLLALRPGPGARGGAATPRAVRAAVGPRPTVRAAPSRGAPVARIAAAGILIAVTVVLAATAIRRGRPGAADRVGAGRPDAAGAGGADVSARSPDPPGRRAGPGPARPAGPPAVVAARVAEVVGPVFRIGEAGEDPARPGLLLDSGIGIRTAAAGARARLVLSDGTRVDLSGRTLIRRLEEGPSGRRIELARGLVGVEAVPQPQGRPLVLATPQAEATVVGTRFALWATGDRSGVAVTEGAVRFARPGGGAPVRVPAGRSAEAAAGGDPADRGPAVAAQPADALVESFGVNVHLRYADTPYAAYDRIVFPALRESGIRHIRDGVTPGHAGLLRKLADLYDRLGIRATLIAGDPRPFGCTAEQAVAFIRALGAHRVAMVEGPNEYDLSGDARWSEVLRERQRLLYHAVKGDPETAGLPVAAPSLASFTAPEAAGDLSAFCDLGNLHNYYGGRHPGTAGWGADGYGSLGWSARRAGQVCGGKPLVSTETGWHNRLDDANHPGVPEPVAAAYLVRLALLQLEAGIVRTHVYELIDCFDDPGRTESHFGLLRHDGSPKPAFAAVKRLLALFADAGPSFAPFPLAFDLAGDMRDVRHALFQRRDGTFLLALWQEVSGYDVASRAILPVAPRDVRLRVALPMARGAIHRPVRSEVPVARVDAPRELALQVPDDPLVVELVPGDGGGG